MSFAKVTQDGDEEGCLFMAGLPTESEAEAIRDKVGIPKKREVSEEELIRLRGYAVANAFAPQERRSPVARHPGSQNGTCGKNADRNVFARPVDEAPETIARSRRRN